MKEAPTLSFRGKTAPASVIRETVPARLRLVRAGTSLVPGDWRNRLIEGDNLPVLRALYDDDAIRGKVRLIYIDPPFATGQTFNGTGKRDTEVAYEDLLVGDAFLDFLHRRLVLLRELLADDGSIYVHIDWKMGHYVKVLMDEVFGQERFINDIARVKCNPKNFARKGYGNVRDMILFYSKSRDFVWNESWETYTPEEIERLFKKVDKDGRRYTTNPLHAPGVTRDGATGKPWRGKKPPRGRHWRYSPDKLDELEEEGLIEWSPTGNPRLRIYADEAHRNDENGNGERRKKRQDVWWLKDPPYPTYPTEKNLGMLRVIVEASSNEGDLVLDGFAGSATTLIAAEQLKRRWIGIDDSAEAVKAAKERLARSAFDLYRAD